MNTNLFNTSRNRNLPQVDTINDAGGTSYALSDKAALLNYACTGTFGSTYYVNAEVQLNRLIELCDNVPVKFVAQAAIYAREKSLLKDVPAVLCAYLANKDVGLLKQVFPKVIDNGKMLKNFVQVIRSGKLNRSSFGTAVKKMIQRWFDNRSDDKLFRESVGNDPSLADVIKMVHPCPKNETRESFYAYLIGKKVVMKKSEMVKNKQGRAETVLFEKLPEIVKEYESYKTKTLLGKDAGAPPDVEFRLLTALSLTDNDWKEIAKNMPWHAARMNLNTMVRHNVFKDYEMVKLIADRLSNADNIRKSRCFPYQLLTAYLNTSDVPVEISNALQDALEIAIENIPTFNAKNIVVLVDTSGSMGSSISGNRGSVTSKVRCVDVASLFASAILRKNPNAEVVLFDTSVYKVKLNGRDSVMTNAQKCARGGGGTDIGCAMRYVAQNRPDADLVFLISDNESWSNSGYGRGYGTTDSQVEWKQIRKNNPNAKMVNIDINPNESAQVKDEKNVLNCGGFGDNIFNIIEMFVDESLGGEVFVKHVEGIDVTPSDPVVQVIKTASRKAAARVSKKK